MKHIFVSHPYQGKKQNKEAITHICRNLIKLGVMPISPVHAFSFLNDNAPEERSKALELCEELVSGCDCLFSCGEWEKSEGCILEHNVALMEMIAIYELIGWKDDMPIFKDGRKPKWMKGVDEK